MAPKQTTDKPTTEPTTTVEPTAQPVAQPVPSAEPAGPVALTVERSRTGALKTIGLIPFIDGMQFSRPRKSASGDRGEELVADVSILLPALGLRIDSGIWAKVQPDPDNRDCDILIPSFSLPRKVRCLSTDDDASVDAVEDFKVFVLQAYADWAKNIGSQAQPAAQRTPVNRPAVSVSVPRLVRPAQPTADNRGSGWRR